MKRFDGEEEEEEEGKEGRKKEGEAEDLSKGGTEFAVQLPQKSLVRTCPPDTVPTVVADNIHPMVLLKAMDSP